ncbi:hypothetical protein TIFTF001_022596 [Ficus carica]|uniref:Non-haem dioxygenase N-terminal domain-containing protein n=1 Tax=Ficus carica TaxID=3494 RepID=A0AA88AIW8_FICCA|nr:hypothetical protein TIFTF001_022596 [Ficus carica]
MASEIWGFFQVVNHGIPVGLMKDMLEGIRKFNEEYIDGKREFYARDRTRKIYFNCNHDLSISIQKLSLKRQVQEQCAQSVPKPSAESFYGFLLHEKLCSACKTLELPQNKGVDI